ncbi:MAG: patatin-like phospholipase family protein [Granulosicoccus sp.]
MRSDDRPTLIPREVHEFEQLRIKQKRRGWNNVHDVDQSLSLEQKNSLKSDVDRHDVGLALSGGGIRSATLSLGLVQALSRKGLLSKIDYLSTVSGGGYLGAFVTGLFTPRDIETEQNTEQRYRDSAKDAVKILSSGAQSNLSRTEQVEKMEPISWLRHNGRYLSVAGANDYILWSVIVARNLLAIHFVIGMPLLLLFYMVGLIPSEIGLPRGVTSFQTAMFPPLTQISLLVILFGALPFLFNYWFTPKELMLRHWSDLFKRNPIFIFCSVVSVIFAAMAVFDSANVWSAWLDLLASVLVVSILTFVALVALLFLRTNSAKQIEEPIVEGRLLKVLLIGISVFALLTIAIYRKNFRSDGELIAWGAIGPDALALIAITFSSIAVFFVFSPLKGLQSKADILPRHIEHLRLCMSRISQFYLTIAFGLLVISFVHLVVSPGLHTMLKNDFEDTDILGIGIGGVGVVTLGRWMVGKALTHVDLVDHVKKYWKALALLLGLFGWFIVLVFWSNVARQLQEAITALYLHVAIIALLTFICISTVLSIGFLNLSTLAQPYSARLRRAYLGASNLSLRRETGSLDVGVNHVNDDINLQQLYSPHSLAPLLLINVTLNQTRGSESQLTLRDRKGQILSVGPAGIAVGHQSFLIDPAVRNMISSLKLDKNYSTWDDPYQISDEATQVSSWNMLGLDYDPNGGDWDCESRSKSKTPTIQKVEALSLSSWAGISGAAVNTGTGRHSTLGLSLLAALLNVRLGYWWHPELKVCSFWTHAWRRLWAPQGWTQWYLSREALSAHDGKTVKFGESEQHRWYLSDGGHFENSAVYELVRREVPLIVYGDFAADLQYDFRDLSILIRTVRIDFGAEIEILDATQLDECLHPDYTHLFGTLSQFQSDEVKPRALLGKIHHASGATSTLIVIKPAINGSESHDLLDYHKHHQKFPQEPTSDQFFDEAQWESYRTLGLSIGEELFSQSKHRNSDRFVPAELIPLSQV